jgi:enoyl-CoA hydratase
MSNINLEKDGGIATVTINNPENLNAINVAMWYSLATIFSTLSADKSLRCVILRGAGGNFAAGADIKEFPSARGTVDKGIDYHSRIIGNVLEAIAGCLHPTVAAIDGVCVGGGLELACACDLRIAAPTSRFGIPVNRLGFPLAPGELQGLLQLVGKATALEIMLEGRIFDAAEAKDKRLIHRIADDVHGEALATARRISAGAPLAARTNKQLVRRMDPIPDVLTEDELRAAFAFLGSDDYKEGVQSFLEKRKPNFTGK